MKPNEQFLFRFKDSNNYQKFSMSVWETLGGEKSGWVKQEEVLKTQPLGNTEVKDLSEISRVSQGKKEPVVNVKETPEESETETQVLPLSGSQETAAPDLDTTTQSGTIEPENKSDGAFVNTAMGPVKPVTSEPQEKAVPPVPEAKGKRPKVIEVTDLK